MKLWAKEQAFPATGYDWVPSVGDATPNLPPNPFPCPIPHPTIVSNAPKIGSNAVQAGEVTETKVTDQPLTSVTIDGPPDEADPNDPVHLGADPGKAGVYYTITVTYHYND